MLTVNVLTVTVKNSVAFLLVEQHGYGYNFGLNFGLLSVGNYNLLYYFTL
jgi:hypothetical protein